MEFLTDKKLVIVGAAGMIGSNMAQCAAMMRLTPNLCLYDTYAPGLEGVAEELAHCGFKGMNITWTTDVKEAFTDAKYMVSSGGAPRKAGMTREDLLRGNAGIAEPVGHAAVHVVGVQDHDVVCFCVCRKRQRTHHPEQQAERQNHSKDSLHSILLQIIPPEREGTVSL